MLVLYWTELVVFSTFTQFGRLNIEHLVAVLRWLDRTNIQLISIRICCLNKFQWRRLGKKNFQWRRMNVLTNLRSKEFSWSLWWNFRNTTFVLLAKFQTTSNSNSKNGCKRKRFLTGFYLEEWKSRNRGVRKLGRGKHWRG